MGNRLINASGSRRCPACHGASSCSFSPDRSMVLCHRRHGDSVPGYEYRRDSDGPNDWGVYVREGEGGRGRRASPSGPCPVCRDHDAGCKQTADGLHVCQSRLPGDAVAGWKSCGHSRYGGGGLWRRAGDSRRAGRPRPHAEAASATPRLDFAALARERHGRAVAGGHLARLAARLGVGEGALAALKVGYDTKRYGLRVVENAHTESGTDWERYEIPGEGCCFPERGGDGTVTGIKFRLPRGGAPDEQRYEPTSEPGLVYPDGLEAGTGPLFCVEGGSCTAAGLTMERRVVGRPSNVGGIDALARLLERLPGDTQVVIVGENDGRYVDGVWRCPGLEGATETARRLAGLLGKTVYACLPPDGHKDVRAYLNAQDPDLADAALLRHLGERFAAEIELVRFDPPPEDAPRHDADGPPAPLEDDPAEDDLSADGAAPTLRDRAVGAALRLGMQPLGVLPCGTFLFARRETRRLVYVLTDAPRPGAEAAWWPFLAGAARGRGFATRDEVRHAELAAWADECGDAADAARLAAEAEAIGVGGDADLAELLAEGAGGEPGRPAALDFSLYQERDVERKIQARPAADTWDDVPPSRPPGPADEAWLRKRCALWARRARPCARPQSMSLQNTREWPRGMGMEVRCKTWGCRGCADWRRIVWMRNLWDRIQAAAEPLYVWRGPQSKFKALQERIASRGRADAKKAAEAATKAGKSDEEAAAEGDRLRHPPYCAVAAAGAGGEPEVLVVTTAAVRDTSPATRDAAAEAVVAAIEIAPVGGRRPVSASKAWKLPDPAAKEWKLLGRHAEIGRAADVLESLGVVVSPGNPPEGGAGGVRRRFHYEFPLAWSDDQLADAMLVAEAVTGAPRALGDPSAPADPTAVFEGLLGGLMHAGAGGDDFDFPPFTPAAPAPPAPERPQQLSLPWGQGDGRGGADTDEGG